MAKRIIVAGGTGKLGGKIIDNLLNKGAEIIALVRTGSNNEKKEKLQQKGVLVQEVDFKNVDALKEACTGAACIVSALQGLSNVIVEVQTNLLQAAVAVGVPRFIPSDFSVDFTKIQSENRNFDLRRQFHAVLDKTFIASTSIFNGAFADILTYNTPMLDLKKKRVGYWGNDADWLLDFTTMDNTAEYTAAAALDDNTPPKLNIASFQISPKQMAALATALTGTTFQLIPMGSLADFAAANKKQRMENPASEEELYPRWQSGQYMHDQFSSHHDKLDNDRYASINWTTAETFIKGIL